MVSTPSSGASRSGGHLSLVTEKPENRRGNDRRRVTIPATVVCPDGTVYACMIRDMSSTGAKLSIGRHHHLPPDFCLSIPGCETTYPVHRAWQRGDFAGVALGSLDAG